MGKRLTDKQKKNIIADYIACQNYSEVARKYGVSDMTVMRTIKNSNVDLLDKVEQKQIENTEDTLTYMTQQHEAKKRIAGKLLKAIEDKADKVDMFTNVKDLSTAYGILVDKELKFAEIKGREGNQEKRYELPARVLGSEWVDINRDIDERDHSQYDFRGGRGSLKSSYCGIKLIDLIECNPTWCGLAVKQQKVEIGDSVYAQIVWAIDELGLTDDYHCVKSPFEIRKKSTGQMIYFRAGNEPSKIKSLRPPNGMHIAIVWIEEADQLQGEEALRSIAQSAFRGGDDGILFRSYNTPRSQQHYINKEAREDNPARIIHHSHFKNAPPKWLGRKFWEDAARLKEINPTAYAHEYDGEAVGTGANVFENVTEREITDAEINTFDNCYYGLDWGWVHPAAFICGHYDPNHLKLYIYHEIYGSNISNRKMAEHLEPWVDCYITADSAEPKSIEDLRDWGYNLQPAYKPPGSREYSTKWLASLAEIIVDPKRCPNAARELIEYEYIKTKDGEITSLLPDVGEDCIAATRYALSPVWSKRGQ